MDYPTQLTITTQSAEMHDRFANSMKGRTIEKIAGLEFAVVATSRDCQGVTAHLGEVTRVDQKWTGAGLPPVGAYCEAEIYDGKGKLVWAESLIIHHHPHHNNSAAIAHGGGQLLGWASKFRPIRTPEQIAAEAREKAIYEMQRLIEESDEHGVFDQLGILYDAGFRKQTDQ